MAESQNKSPTDESLRHSKLSAEESVRKYSSTHEGSLKVHSLLSSKSVGKRGVRVNVDEDVETSTMKIYGQCNQSIKKITYEPQKEFIRPNDAIPFHIPHKKLLEKIEAKKERLEPLTGLNERQAKLMEYRHPPTLSIVDIKVEDSKVVHIKAKHVPTRERIKHVGEVNQQEMIDLCRNDTEGKFYYMIYSVSRSSEFFTPYSLMVVPYEDVKMHKTDFLTISKRGVLQTHCRETIFTTLDIWEYEYQMYKKLMKFKTFSLFRMWKAFYVWKKGIFWRKMDNVKEFLENNLFILNPILRDALLNLQAMCFKFMYTSFVNVSNIENFHFFYFNEDQMEQFETLRDKLKEFRIVAKELVNNACHGALLERGFTTDDSSFFAQFVGKRRRKIEGEPKMSYTEQAHKKKYCIRLSCFITLVDYLCIAMLHLLIWNAITDLRDALETHFQFIPSDEKLDTPDIDTLLEEPRPADAPKLPLFNINLMVDLRQLKFDPSQSIIVQIFDQLYDLWYELVTAFQPYLPDQFFNPFLHPLINGKIEDRICGYGPRVAFYIVKDTDLKARRDRIYEIIHLNYQAAFRYVNRFNYMQVFFQEDCAKTQSEIEEERSLENWRNMCYRYNFEIKELKSIVESQPLGFMHIKFEEFKSDVIPQPTRLLRIIDDFMPKLGKMKVDALLDQSNSTQEYLETSPESTIDYVKYIEFIDQAIELIDEMEMELDYLKELFDIMEEYKIPIDPNDMQNYLGVSVTLGGLRGLVDRTVEERGLIVEGFSEQINKDINGLISQIGNIKEECMAPWLIDIESDMEDAKAALDVLYQKILNCQKTATEFKGYQKQFRVEVTRFDMLDEVVADIKLRMLLWETMDVWYKTVVDWYSADFSTLDVEDMNTFTAKNVKNVTNLEKGLPRNQIVPLLKEDIATMKDKLPVIGYLRNPSLRPRHWNKIEQTLNYKFKVDEIMTLKLLENLQCFTYPNELMELSGQASSEASLELMLKKVEEVWETLEFVVMPHKDVKDVYILGTLEEVQQVLDDSHITINTIVNSRHVGPIKPRVDEWVEKLNLFSRTLEAWQQCQQSWVYLEVIFSAPDIQRQLPAESKLFIIVDKSWKEIMRRTFQMPLAMEACLHPGLLDALERNNDLLDQIMKCLESYLETKRVAFPRFYFLSNDELLDILAQTRNPHAVQPHLRKCFDAIAKLEFGTKAEGEGEVQVDTPVLTTDIIAMISPEGERVPLGKGLKARGNVEDWLRKVEDSMFLSLKKIMKFAIGDFIDSERNDWLPRHPNQVVLTVSQIMWAKDVHEILDGPGDRIAKMSHFEGVCNKELNGLAGLVCTPIIPLFRKVLVALITISVHARDTITNMVQNRVQKSADFDWLKMMRYYWNIEIDNCQARMSSAEYIYGYEYLGAGGVLVITPLTDRCYLCLMGALQLDLGGAPAGPAGTGKTETTKDLAKSLAIQCVVFNCSEGLDYKMMGRFFSGLAQSGAWCCFDEFNRIDIEVLSVIAQQLITIRNAKAAKLKRFMFEGREIKLVPSCAAFITMNPGYAGRTELPDNLKALFRPISMMVPDYALIAEVTLYSEGFESSKILARKMVQMYKLCSEQLSQQDHYDFGMRAVKSVLVMAGALKRSNPDKSEDVVLIRALRDSNLPKFLADDAILFGGILSDLFPGVVLPEQDYGVLQKAIEDCTILQGFQIIPEQVVKVIQLYETMIVRWGVMLVGPTGGGKSSVLKTLKDALTKLHNDEVPGDYYQIVFTYILNPKSVTLGELYGEVNPFSMEWRDGLLGIMVRIASSFATPEHQWVICDGPVDAVWIENMNTVLDDNKMLCLANSERIKLTPYVHMVFEVQDLAQASPATVSRCGMVYVDSEDMKYMAYVNSWLKRVQEKFPYVTEEVCGYIIGLFERAMDKGLNFVKKKCDFVIHQVDISKINMFCHLFQSIVCVPGAIDKIKDKNILYTFLVQSFVFSYLWSIGGNLTDDSRDNFESLVREQFDEHPDARLPNDDLWNVYMNLETKRLETWLKIQPAFKYDKTLPFFETIVPTMDTVRFGYIMEKLITVNKSVLFTGGTGVGKSVIAKVVLSSLYSTGVFVPVTLNFSAQTSSARTQEMIELKLEKQKKTQLGAPYGKRVVVFVDDVNMPKLDTYGSQPPIELLRQYLDYGGLYDRDKLFWKKITDVIITAACAPPGGGRNPLTPRFVRHFAMLNIPSPNDLILKNIFRVIMKGFLTEFTNPVRDLGESMVSAAVDIYERIAEDLLPTPAKSHYVFNLRDLSKCVQGILQADSGIIREAPQMQRLFYHECLRVFHDRLINAQDKSYFYKLMQEVCNRNFGTPVLNLPDDHVILDPPILLFGDFMVFGAEKENRIYEEIINIPKMKAVLQEYLDDYNLSTSKEMKIIFFMDALQHITRLARMLRAERGNALLVGVGGMGKQSLTRLSSHVNSYCCMQIELARNYDHSSFFEDLRKIYFRAGGENENTVFLFTDTQIVEEEFLEDINNILNSGEVPNLFEADEYEKVMTACRPDAKKSGVDEGNRDGIYEFFIKRVRQNLHLSLCMSPVGDAFRRRCRMFPSLVNCCTIDWFMEWPEEALLSVAEDTLANVGDEELIQKISKVCVIIHKSVENMTVRFYNEMRRHYYTTPSSYLDLLKLYHLMLKTKGAQTKRSRDRIANGLNKIFETNQLIDDMKIMLTELKPQLAIKSVDVENLMKNLVQEQAAADKVRVVVKADEVIAAGKAADTQAIADDAQRDLDEALPAMEAATKALDSLNKKDIDELRVFKAPPKLVQFVLEAVCLLLGAKPDWAAAKQLLSDTNFLKRLYDYDKDHIPDKMLAKLKVYVDNKDFKPDIVGNVSKVCKSICMWVRAIDTYAKVFRVVEPKRQKQRMAETELKSVMEVLREKQKKLADVEKHIANLEAMFNRSVREKKDLEDNMELTAQRLIRAGRLTTALADEQVRWEEDVLAYKVIIDNMIGDILLSAACVAYLGAFTNNYREELSTMWHKKCIEYKIPVTEIFSLIEILADPYEIRIWNTCGLPRDSVSTENAILVTKAERWPLMIDPQEQANRWIRQMEAENNLLIIKLTDSFFMRNLENAVRLGAPVLLEEIGETLDPTLQPILLKQIFFSGGRNMIRIGDTDVEYDSNFKFYMTTKMSNPHYMPEVCIQVTIVNFTVTPSGLEDQLLADVVRLERPDLEQQRNELIIRINNDKGQLLNIEDKILKMLYFSEGNILDDEELIETLNESKETSAIIASRLIETEATEKKISVAREKYRSVATRGSVLYFVVARLADIDPMYQYSLKYFTSIFNIVIDTSEKNDDLEIRLNILYKEITLAIYVNVSRGLFERHKLVYSFMLCVDILKQAKKITEEEWTYLIRGPGGTHADMPKKPDVPTLSEFMWISANFLSRNFKTFHPIVKDIFARIPIQIGDFRQEILIYPSQSHEQNVNWDTKLDDFQKLMLLRSLKEEKLVFAMTEYVKLKLGKTFVESPQTALNILYQDTSNITPLVFVLSTGSDPFGAFQRFAADMGKTKNYQSISLGQGQGPVAEKMIATAKSKGDWVFLQNCHLATSWMIDMERTIQQIIEDPRSVHREFRLYLSSMPTNKFPVSVLQNSVKVTNEPPKGLRANIKRAFADMLDNFFEEHVLEQDWRSMIFGISMFHAIIQERKKFGPLGWNIIYEFNDSDRECAFDNMKMFCASGTIPWDALEYITGEITYGGRVTDYWDLRCLKTILKIFFAPHILAEDYTYSPSGIYYCPRFEKIDNYRGFIDNLPIIEEPEIFGMHENANIAFQTKETYAVILTILESQPRSGGGETGKSSDQIVYEFSDKVVEMIKPKISTDEPHNSLFKKDDKGRVPSLTTVLLQEIDRFNKLLKLIHTSLDNLQKAIKGLVVMSDDLERVFIAFLNNQVPAMWAAKAYPSLKPLSSWVVDLTWRVDFITYWLTFGAPESFWISGFFFPQGFLTGTLQTHARKYDLPIDELKFDFKITSIMVDQVDIKKYHDENETDNKEIYGGLKRPTDGVIVHGLYMDACRFNLDEMILEDQSPGEMNPAFPAMMLIPVQTMPKKDPRYQSPLYKTSARAGVLSTTGHSTNFVVTVFITTDRPQSYWILKGAALLTQTNE